MINHKVSWFKKYNFKYFRFWFISLHFSSSSYSIPTVSIFLSKKHLDKTVLIFQITLVQTNNMYFFCPPENIKFLLGIDEYEYRLIRLFGVWYPILALRYWDGIKLVLEIIEYTQWYWRFLCIYFFSNNLFLWTDSDIKNIELVVPHYVKNLGQFYKLGRPI